MIRIILSSLLASICIAATSEFPTDRTIHAIVTGGSDGIGASIVDELAKDSNIKVLACARNDEKLRASLKDRPNVFGVVADVSTSSGRQKLIEEAERVFEEKRIDVLVNNVGTNIRKTTVEYTEDEYDHVMNTNLKSCFALCQLAHPLLCESRCASIVNIGSVVGMLPSKTGSIYSMTKAAMNQLTGNLACEWAKDGIRVNCVCPWYINTPLAQQVLKDSAYLKTVLSRTPMGRVGEVHEVANVVKFFASPASSYCTGQVIAVDGGHLKMGFY